MCTVSVITDYGMQRFPQEYWTPQTWPTFKQLVKEAEVFDKATDQADCVDPEKDAWMKVIEARIEKLEAAAFRKA